MDENKPVPKQEEEVKWYSYVALLFSIVFFSGILSTSKEWYSVCDFTVLNGTFGKIAAANIEVPVFPSFVSGFDLYDALSRRFLTGQLFRHLFHQLTAFRNLHL